MLLSLLLISLIAAGGLALTYLITDDEPFMWRLAAGSVMGSAVCGIAAFIIASVFGLNAATAAASIAIAILPLALFYRDRHWKQFRTDWARAKGKLQGASWAKFLRFAYYAFFLLLFLSFFSRAMFVAGGSIFTGGSQNLGDLPFHLGAIFSFTEGNNFPPENPSFAGAKFSYPFIADLLTAVFIKLGTDVRDAMFVQNVAWAFALLIILERFVFKLLNDRLAARMAPFLLFFSGGLGFIWFFGDYWAQGKSLTDFLGSLPKDYTTGEGFSWGNSMVTLFMTQRSLLLGMPLTLIVLGILWRIFNTREHRRQDEKEEFSVFQFPFSAFVAGLMAGLLPLIHLHSLAVLFIFGVFLLVLKPEKWHEWISFAAGAAVIAVPELVWSLAGSASETAKFFEWHFGWNKKDENFLRFWFVNTGLFIPLLAFGLWLVFSTQRRRDSEKGEKEALTFVPKPSSLLYFYLPFAFLFLLCNVAKLAPWEWDNIKVLIYWFVGSIPFAVFAIAWLWRRAIWARLAAGICILVLTLSGALDVWRVVSGQINYKVFDKDAVTIARRINAAAQPDALFLNAPTYNSAVVLSGRLSLMRYSGHLGSHGIDYAEREADVKRIYQGGPEADPLLAKYGIDYVLISPEEKSSMQVNDPYFMKFPVAAQVGQYRVHKVR